MPTVSRELEIRYGAAIIGGRSSTHLLDGPYSISRNENEMVVEFGFLTTATTEPGFTNACETVERDLSTPWQNLTVVLGSSTLIDTVQDQNSGFDAEPEILKRGGVDDSGRARKYSARIRVGLPATWNADTRGVRSSTVNVSYTPARRRRVTITGEMTAVGTNTARAQYAAQIATFATAALNVIDSSATWELIDEPETEASTNNKTIRFTRVYEELIFAQAGASGTDDTDIVSQTFTISRRDLNDGTTGDGVPFVTLNARWDAWIDKEQTTNLTAKWAAVRSWAISQMQTVLSGSSFALMQEDPDYNFDQNRITVDLVAVGVGTNGKNTLSRLLTTEDEWEPGEVLVPAWTGNPLSRYRYNGVATLTRTVTEIVRLIGLENVADQAEAAREVAESQDVEPNLKPNPGGAGGSRWSTQSQRTSVLNSIVGLSGNQVDVTDVTTITIRQFYADIAPST